MAPHAPWDQSGKQVLRQFYRRAGLFTAEEELRWEPQRTDGRFIPDRARLWTLPDGLLGRIGQEACTFEVYSRTPSEQTLVGCVRKVLNLRHTLMLDEHPEPMPRLWVISTGHPATGIEALGAKRNEAWPTGVYEAPRGLQTSIVALNQLPEDRSTLLLRLMGRGQTFDTAVTELLASPQHAWERQMAIPILSQYHDIEQPNPELSPEMQAYLKAIEPVKKRWEEWWDHVNPLIDEALDRGYEQGQQKAHQGALVDVYTARFGPAPDALRNAVAQTHDEATLRRWLSMIATSTQDDIAATILQGQGAIEI